MRSGTMNGAMALCLLKVYIDLIFVKVLEKG